ncbi:hypothetical protein ACIO93_44175 [Streptomyces sp. NPDC087903]|uniref:hypothetical protein n=1 Tax=Streptomyces sp. NPDC087903 TaxID=3365819 RepID=UPI00381150D9
MNHDGISWQDVLFEGFEVLVAAAVHGGCGTRSDQLVGVSRYRVPSDGTQWAGTGSGDGCHSRLISP